MVRLWNIPLKERPLIKNPKKGKKKIDVDETLIVDNDLKIKIAEKGHLEKLVDIWIALREEMIGFGDQTILSEENISNVKEYFYTLIDKKRIIIGILKEQLIGFITYDDHQLPLRNKSQGIIINDLYFSPEHRNKEYGSVLLRESIKYIRKNNIYGYILVRVNRENSNAIQFYSRHGFKTQYLTMRIDLTD